MERKQSIQLKNTCLKNLIVDYLVEVILLGIFAYPVWIGTALRRRGLLYAGDFVCDYAIGRQRYKKDRTGSFPVVGRHVQRKEFFRSRISPSPAALARLAVFMRRHRHGRSGKGKVLRQ